MVWPFKPKTRKQIARIEITGAIASDTRQRVLKALEIVKERQYPALLLRIDSPGTKCQTIEEPKPPLSRLTGNRSQIPSHMRGPRLINILHQN